jgi:hypothetical protein
MFIFRSPYFVPLLKGDNMLIFRSPYFGLEYNTESAI